MSFALPLLQYWYEELEPVIDEQTMRIHHTKHHQGYIDKLNASLAWTEYESRPIEQLFDQMMSLPAPLKISVGNNGGGYFNHCLFWECMCPGWSSMTDTLRDKFVVSFGSVDELKLQFRNIALWCFGSGWAWLIVDHDGNLALETTTNQYNPVMNLGGYVWTPLLCLDVWEHAYYLHYQNRRADYIDARWDVVDRRAVEERVYYSN